MPSVERDVIVFMENVGYNWSITAMADFVRIERQLAREKMGVEAVMALARAIHKEDK